MTQSTAASKQPPLRVRIRRGYPLPFVLTLGQRNAVFVSRSLTPLNRFFAWADAFAVLPEPDYDIVHSMNAVPLLTSRPYIITFEDYLPRVPDDRYIGWLERWLTMRLLNPQCVGMIGMSDYALRQFRWQQRGFPQFSALEAKLRRIYPAVSPRRTAPKQRSGKTLKLVFVGGDDMRKGCPALLRAHEQLRRQGVPVETTIISHLNWTPDDYVGPPSEEYVRQERARLAQPGITHYPGLPHEQTLQRMEESDYFVFPTLHDTFGYVSIESLACGTPALVSGTCAQPEIVEDGKCGYVLPFENDEHVGKWRWIYRNHDAGYLDAYDQAIQTMADGLVKRLLACWEAPGEQYEAMSTAALERVRTRFSVSEACTQLEDLYDLCRSRL